MTWTLQEISDRLEITETITRYSYGLDQRRWEEWDLAFTDDAVIDFSAFGMTPASPADVRQIFSQGDPLRISGQHLLSNIVIRLDGDTATTHAEFTMVTLARVEGTRLVRRARAGGWYEDQLVRSDAGWRIRRHTGYGKWNQLEEIPAGEAVFGGAG
jgi:hypothetical protein